MWRVGSVFLFTIIAAVWVGAGESLFEILLDKDRGLCSAMLTLINKDVEEHGRINYDSHTEFTSVKWGPSNFVSDKFKEDSCLGVRVAQFDLTNDGKDDLVLRFRWCFRDRLSDKIYFFTSPDPALSSSAGLEDVEARSLGEFPAQRGGLGNYVIKELPQDKIRSGVTPGEGVGGWMVINPFLYKGVWYLAATDRGRSGGDEVGDGFVIGKYKGRGELDNICYFRKRF